MIVIAYVKNHTQDLGSSSIHCLIPFIQILEVPLNLCSKGTYISICLGLSKIGLDLLQRNNFLMCFFFFFKIFGRGIWTIFFKVFIEFVTMLLVLCIVFLAARHVGP